MKSSPKFNEILGQTIRKIRMEKGMTIDQLAEHSKISTKHLGKIERGQVSVSAFVLMLIEKGLGFKNPGKIFIGDLLDLYQNLDHYVKEEEK